MALIALEVALQMVKELAPLAGRIENADRSLGDQLRRSASSVVLNVAEGAERRGRDRPHCFRIAAGSLAEARAALRLAVAWGHVGAERLTAAEAHADRLAALLYGLAHRDRRVSDG